MRSCRARQMSELHALEISSGVHQSARYAKIPLETLRLFTHFDRFALHSSVQTRLRHDDKLQETPMQDDRPINWNQFFRLSMPDGASSAPCVLIPRCESLSFVNNRFPLLSRSRFLQIRISRGFSFAFHDPRLSLAMNLSPFEVWNLNSREFRVRSASETRTICGLLIA